MLLGNLSWLIWLFRGKALVGDAQIPTAACQNAGSLFWELVETFPVVLLGLPPGV